MCGTSFRRFGGTLVQRELRWPRGDESASVTFRRDISARARWCLVETTGRLGGGDVAFVSFHRAEPRRPLTAGHLADGTRWRMRAWRGDRLEPCVELGIPDESSSRRICFGAEAEREAALDAVSITPTCSGETLVVGVTARRARSVVLTVEDGSTVEAELHARPEGSRVRARYFLAWFPQPPEVVALAARGLDGELVDRDRGLSSFGVACGRAGRVAPPS